MPSQYGAQQPSWSSGRQQASSWSTPQSNQKASWNAPASPSAQKVAPSGALKPQPPAVAGGAVAAKKTADAAALTVSSQSKRSDIGIPTLCGDYAEKGMNHGKKYYQKIQKIVGHEDVKVFLYYWDNRDGADFAGWWFGDQLGGSQVWARCSMQSQQPPRTGWKLPWDAPKAEPGLLFVDQFKGTPQAASAAVSSTAPAAPGRPTPPAASPASVAKATKQIEAAEKEANDTLVKVKAKMTATATEAVLKEVQEMLQKQQTALAEVQKSLTQEINSARAQGPSGMATVTELSKLSPKLKAVQTGITGQLQQAKAKATQAAKQVQDAAKQKEQQAQLKKQEEENQKELKGQLAQATDTVSLAEDGVEACTILAQPFFENPSEAQGPEFNKACEEIEKTANEAQSKIAEARKDVNAKVQAARKFAPETRKVAIDEFTKLQTKLTEAQKKLAPYKSFKKELAQRAESKKALDDIVDKLSAAEVEVEKVALMTAPGEIAQMPEAEVTAAEEAIKPAQTGLQAAARLIDTKFSKVDGTLKEDLAKLKERSSEAKKKLDACIAAVKKNREGLATTQMLATAEEKVAKIDSCLAKCAEAEMPFLKGIEVLPADESAKAISDLESAASVCGVAVSQAKQFLLSKTNEAKKYQSKELSKEVTEKLGELSKRVEESNSRLQTFKKETSERKIAALMAEVVESTAVAEQKVKDLTEVAKIFSSDSLEQVSIQALQEAGEKTAAMSKEAEEALTKARNTINSKKKENKAADAATALQKFQGRLSTATAEKTKLMKAAATGDKIIKDKQVLADEEAAIKGAEEQAEKASLLATPPEGEKLTDEAIKEMDELTTNATKALKQTARTAESRIPQCAPMMKASFEKLLERSKKAQETLEKIKKDTKDQREKVLSEVYVEEGNKKVQELEAALEKVNAVELPFLKGIEVLPLDEATATIKESEEAAALVQTCIGQARTYIAAKNLEVKNFEPAFADPAKEKLNALLQRVQAGTQKLSQFRKDTEGRKRTTQMQQAGEMLSSIEGEVKKVTEAVEPFVAQDLDSMPVEEADEVCKKFFELQQGAQGKVEEARTFLAERSRDVKNQAEHKETLTALQARLASAKAELDKARKAAQEREHKYTSKKLLAEAKEMIDGLENEKKEVADKCAPMVQEECKRFLVAASISNLATVLKEHMSSKDLSIDAFFKEISKGKSVSKDAFAAWLKQLPEAISRDEVTFPEERCAAIAEQVSVGTDQISLDEFKAIFQVRFICVQKVTLTDVFEVAKSKTLAKISNDDVLEGIGLPKQDESSGIVRVECRIPDSGVTGWITMTGNSGTKYLEEVSQIADFTKELHAAVGVVIEHAKKGISFLSSKIAEIAGSTEGAYQELRAGLLKMKPQVLTLQKELNTLNKQVDEAKAKFEVTATKEKNAHIEVREKKAAEALIAPTREAVAKAEELSQKFETAAAPLKALKDDELKTFATPVTVQEECKALSDSLQEAIVEAKKKVKEPQSQLTPLRGAMLEAKRELGKMHIKVENIAKQKEKTFQEIQKACSIIAEASFEQASIAFRKEVQTSGKNKAALFEELAGGKEAIPGPKFVAKLEAIGVKGEQAKLLAKNMEVGGAGDIVKRRFMTLVEQYYVVLKDIAITNVFPVRECKTLRKAEVDEIIEVVEGPCVEEKTNLARIRGKSMRDGTEGWISLKGNQGTPFLSEVEKPYYSIRSEVTMEKDFTGQTETVRSLEADEIIELLEGPKKEVYNDATRIRGKTLDGRTGWITASDHKGTVFAEPAKRYFKCTSSVAITDSPAIKECKVLRKLSVGEIFHADEDPTKEEASGILRVKGKALKDDQAGWISVKGNAGTVYAEPTAKHYMILKEVQLQPVFSSQSTKEPLGVLKEGEAFEVVEGPKTEKFEPVTRVKGRALQDGAVGWITLSTSNVRAWSPYYKCTKTMSILKEKAKDSEVVRELAAGEIVEFLEGPEREVDGEAKRLIIKARADKDAAIGWMTVKDAKGQVFLESAA